MMHRRGMKKAIVALARPTRSSSAAVSRDLPMPGSPESSTTWPSPVFAFDQRRSSEFEFFLPPDKLSQPRVQRLEAALD